jgi:hypothetical protein
VPPSLIGASNLPEKVVSTFRLLRSAAIPGFANEWLLSFLSSSFLTQSRRPLLGKPV